MTLHIYAQYCHHTEAEIVGTKESLEKLRNAIDRTLNQGYYIFEDEVNDGEGYEIYVTMLSEEEMMNQHHPYTAPFLVSPYE